MLLFGVGQYSKPNLSKLISSSFNLYVDTFTILGLTLVSLFYTVFIFFLLRFVLFKNGFCLYPLRNHFCLYCLKRFLVLCLLGGFYCIRMG